MIRKMKRELLPLIIIVALIALLVISGCDTGTWPGMPEKGISIFGGGTGIKTIFVMPANGMELPLGYEITPKIRLEDQSMQGSDGEVCISKQDSAECECRDFETSTNPEHENYLKEEQEFSSFAITKGGEYILSEVTRYNYKTTAAALACIRAEPFEEGECEIIVGKQEGAGILQSASGGPIKITNIKESVIPIGDTVVNLLFSIYVKNVAGKPSDLIKEEDVYSGVCKAAQYKEDNPPEIRIEIEGLLYAEYIDCGTIKLNDKGEGSIVCLVENYNLVDKENEYLFEEKEEIGFTVTAGYAFETRGAIKFRVS